MTKTRELSIPILFILVLACGGALAGETPEGPIGKVSQPIVVGDPVTVARQRELGLVTINNSGRTCSATLLNRSWVLTADHCLTTNGLVGGPEVPVAQLSVTATWRSGSVRPTRSVRYGDTDTLDVALLFLGKADFGPRDGNVRLIFHGVVDKEMTLTKFGQGNCTFATAGPPATAAQANCGYRSAVFTPSSASETRIVLPANGSGQVGNGGDSGGPDFVTGADDAVLSIASVQSTCLATGYVPGQPAIWRWATGISWCDSAALFTLRDDILERIKEVPRIDTVSNVPGAVGVGNSKPVSVVDTISNKPGNVSVRDRPVSVVDTISNVPGSAGVGAVLAHGTFTGLWSTVTAAGNRYTMRLTQNGDVVSGTYELESGGATGTIAGTIDQGSLSYRWNEGGSKGSGKFTLAADGKSFTGWWNSGEDPNTIGSSWNGTRK